LVFDVPPRLTGRTFIALGDESSVTATRATPRTLDGIGPTSPRRTARLEVALKANHLCEATGSPGEPTLPRMDTN
jgi:hypothetical protein